VLPDNPLERAAGSHSLAARRSAAALGARAYPLGPTSLSSEDSEGDRRFKGPG
jgi:hypothetical protein